MQTVITLPSVQQRGYVLDDDPAAIADAYRKLCQRKRLPYVAISRSGRAYLVRLDMAPTGGNLNAIGSQVVGQLAFHMGSMEPVTTGIKAYSLPAAEKVAKKLLNVGKDKRFREP